MRSRLSILMPSLPFLSVTWQTRGMSKKGENKEGKQGKKKRQRKRKGKRKVERSLKEREEKRNRKGRGISVFVP